MVKIHKTKTKRPLRIDLFAGTRPEVIKLAPVALEAKRRGHNVRMVFTGQHKHLALPLLEFFGLRADLSLDTFQAGQTLVKLSSKLLAELDDRVLQDRADIILVQGDTTSALIAGYWGFCHGISVGHVEAGLRTYDLTQPFPEEANRQLLSRIANHHFAPTLAASRALKSERVNPRSILVCGNTGIDALNITLDRIKSNPASIPTSEQVPSDLAQVIERHDFALVTAHRRENHGKGLNSICSAILKIAAKQPELHFIVPVHPNPNVRPVIEQMLGNHPQMHLCAPLAYVAFIALMSRAKLILTDSGGVQEEAPTLRKPILVMRDKTERTEGVKAGFAKLVGTHEDKIVSSALIALRQGCKGRGKNPYGDGKTSARILREIELKS